MLSPTFGWFRCDVHGLERIIDPIGYGVERLERLAIGTRRRGVGARTSPRCPRSTPDTRVPPSSHLAIYAPAPSDPWPAWRGIGESTHIPLPAGRQASEPGSAGTSTACFLSASSGTMSRARACVAARTTGAATPASYACNHRDATTHHLSPGRKPGKWYSGRGVVRSFPICRWCCRNSVVTTAHTV